MDKDKNKVIKYKGRFKDQKAYLKVNPDLYEPAIRQKDYAVIDEELLQNNRNESTTMNYFTNTKDLDAKIKHKKQRIGD